MKTSSRTSSYMPELDGVRAIAVSMVMVEHLAPRPDALQRWVPWGFLGVHLFFVISGFLITGILLRARDEARGAGRVNVLFRFLIRRGLRIWPLYCAVVLVLCLFSPAVRDVAGWFIAYAVNILFAVRNQWVAASHFWSLSVEEQFYVFWPLLVLFLPRRYVLGAIWTLIAIAPISRIALVASGLAPDIALLQTPACLDSLGAGALLAWHGKVGRCLRWPLALTGTLILAGTCFNFSSEIAWSLALRGVGTAMLFLVVVDAAARGDLGFWSRVLVWSPLRWVGKVSYGIYVFHFLVPRQLERLHLGEAQLGGWTTCVLSAAISFALAALSWRFLEAPFNRLKEKFPYVSGQGGTHRIAAPPGDEGVS